MARSPNNPPPATYGPKKPRGFSVSRRGRWRSIASMELARSIANSAAESSMRFMTCRIGQIALAEFNLQSDRQCRRAAEPSDAEQAIRGMI
jgi:hypothetical protein